MTVDEVAQFSHNHDPRIIVLTRQIYSIDFMESISSCLKRKVVYEIMPDAILRKDAGVFCDLHVADTGTILPLM